MIRERHALCSPRPCLYFLRLPRSEDALFEALDPIKDFLSSLLFFGGHFVLILSVKRLSPVRREFIYAVLRRIYPPICLRSVCVSPVQLPPEYDFHPVPLTFDLRERDLGRRISFCKVCCQESKLAIT